MQAHSFYETLQKSKVSVEDLAENTEVCAGNEKCVFGIIRGPYPNKRCPKQWRYQYSANEAEIAKYCIYTFTGKRGKRRKRKDA